MLIVAGSAHAHRGRVSVRRRTPVVDAALLAGSLNERSASGSSASTGCYRRGGVPAADEVLACLAYSTRFMSGSRSVAWPPFWVVENLVTLTPNRTGLNRVCKYHRREPLKLRVYPDTDRVRANGSR